MLQLPSQVADRPRKGKRDPIFTLIDAHHATQKKWIDLTDAHDIAEFNARAVHGDRPFGLIAWRRHSAIGSYEITNYRERLIEQGHDAGTIEREHADALKRLKAAIRAGSAWDRKAGIATLRRDRDRAAQLHMDTNMRMARTSPTTGAGFAALMKVVLDNELCDDIEWHKVALATVAAGLEAMAEKELR